jgi:hypothetical protein
MRDTLEKKKNASCLIQSSHFVQYKNTFIANWLSLVGRGRAALASDEY